MSDHRYPLSATFWRTEGVIYVQDVSQTQICTIPLGFLKASRDGNWLFIKSVILDCVEEDGTIETSEHRQVSLDELVTAGHYIYRRSDDPSLPCTFRRGPDLKYKYRPPTSGGSTSTMSDSKRSSINQNRFRNDLTARDGVCLLTGRTYDACTASHIIPLTRPDLYEQILGYPETFLFYPWMGLLLEDTFHHSFDRGDWAFYPRNDGLVVHYFDHSRSDFKHLHGLVVPYERFRGPASWRPDHSLLLFHHRQCVQMHMRGFAHRMGPPVGESM